MTQTLKDVGQQLESYRLDRVWTLRELSDRTGVSITTLGNIVSGRHKPHRLTVAKLRKAIPDLFREGK